LNLHVLLNAIYEGKKEKKDKERVKIELGQEQDQFKSKEYDILEIIFFETSNPAESFSQVMTSRSSSRMTPFSFDGIIETSLMAWESDGI